MALIKCAECGKEISDKALSCPNCGYPVEADDIIFNSDNPIDNEKTMMIWKLIHLFSPKKSMERN